MKLSNFIEQANLNEMSEIEKVKHLAYYYKAKASQQEFTFDDIRKWFITDLDHSSPNLSRLKVNIGKSKDFVKGTKEKSYKLNSKTLSLFENAFKLKEVRSDEIETINSILPDSLYNGTRGFIESLAKQINASYENNINDGCAVLMRRLLEICLILAYQHLKIESEIKNQDQSYKMLDGIINNALTNSNLGLSKDTKSILHDFRELGNYSAHKMFYNCRKSEIELLNRRYRATIEELFYKAGLKK